MIHKGERWRGILKVSACHAKREEAQVDVKLSADWARVTCPRCLADRDAFLAEQQKTLEREEERRRGAGELEEWRREERVEDLTAQGGAIVRLIAAVVAGRHVALDSSDGVRRAARLASELYAEARDEVRAWAPPGDAVRIVVNPDEPPPPAEEPDSFAWGAFHIGELNAEVSRGINALALIEELARGPREGWDALAAAIDPCAPGEELARPDRVENLRRIVLGFAARRKLEELAGAVFELIGVLWEDYDGELDGPYWRHLKRGRELRDQAREAQ